jgi:hypothetical protein
VGDDVGRDERREQERAAGLLRAEGSVAEQVNGVVMTERDGVMRRSDRMGQDGVPKRNDRMAQDDLGDDRRHRICGRSDREVTMMMTKGAG